MAAGELVVSIIGDMRELSKTFSQAQTEIGKIGKEFEEMGKKLTNTGKTMSTYVTAPLVGIGAISLHTAANFDDSMRKVQAVSGATGEDFDKLSTQARELGATTAFSASDAANAMYYLSLAGWDVNETMSATPGLLSLASAAGMDLGQAADIVSDTMSAFQMEASGAGTAADIFAAASSNSNTDVLQLGEAMKYASSTANSAGMDLAQTSTVLGILADSGIKGSMAGTSFNAMLRDMKKNALDGTIAIGRHVIALYNADGTMRSLGDIMADVNVATEGMTTKQRDAALSAIFQEESIRGVNIMLAAGTERYDELEGKIRDSDGAAKRMAETMEGGVGGAMREMKSATEEMMITLGNILVVAVFPLIESLTDLFNWFSELPEPIQKGVVAFLAVIAVIGPLLIAIGAVVSAVGTVAGAFGAGGALAGAISFVSATLLPALSTAFGIVAYTVIPILIEALGILITPFGLAAVAIAALALAWKNNWFDIQGKTKAAVDFVKTQWDKFTSELGRLPGVVSTSFSTLSGIFSSSWNSIKTYLSTALTGIITDLQNWVSKQNERFNNAIASINTLKTHAVAKWTEIQTAIKIKLTELINDIQTWIANQVTKYNDAVVKINTFKTQAIAKWNEIKTAIKTKFNELIADAQIWISSTVSKLNDMVSRYNTFSTQVISKWIEIRTAIRTKLEEIISDIQNWINRQNDKFSQAVASVNDLKTRVIKAFSDMLSEIRTKINEIINAIKELPAKVKALGTEAYNAGKALVQKLIDGLKSKLQEVKNTVSEITKLSSITESSAAKSVKSAGSSVVDTIKSAGTKAKVSLTEAAQGLRRLLPSSPAKEGPFKKLPNWDAVFVDPLEESIKTAKGFTAPLKSTLSSLRSPLDSMTGGLKHVSNVSTSSTNYEGSTYSIGPNYVRNDSDLQAIISAVKSSIANDRRRKGIFS